MKVEISNEAPFVQWFKAMLYPFGTHVKTRTEYIGLYCYTPL